AATLAGAAALLVAVGAALLELPDQVGDGGGARRALHLLGLFALADARERLDQEEVPLLVDIHTAGEAVLALAAGRGHLLEFPEFQRGHEREDTPATGGDGLEHPFVAGDPQEARRVDEVAPLSHQG